MRFLLSSRCHARVPPPPPSRPPVCDLLRPALRNSSRSHRAETVAYVDFVKSGSLSSSREAGTLRSEGKDYVVQEGDVLLFRFNV